MNVDVPNLQPFANTARVLTHEAAEMVKMMAGTQPVSFYAFAVIFTPHRKRWNYLRESEKTEAREKIRAALAELMLLHVVDLAVPMVARWREPDREVYVLTDYGRQVRVILEDARAALGPESATRAGKKLP